MKLQDQVCTLVQAKRLQELGIRQDASHAAWLRNECHKETEFWCWPVEAQGVTNRGYASPAKGCLEGFSAFTVAELGVMLGKFWEHELIFAYEFETDNEAIERAHMLIGALQTNQVTAEEVNARLCA